MKRIACIVLGLLMVGIPVFAGGGNQAAGSQDGLTTLKVWGRNTPFSSNNETVLLSELANGTKKNVVWDKFVAGLAARGIKLDMTLVMEDQLTTSFQTLVASGQINNYDWVAPVVDEKTRLSLVEQKRIIPLNQAIQQYSTGPAREYYFNTTNGKYFAKMDTLEDGNFYWLTQNLFSYYGDTSRPFGRARLGMIRQDWLTKLGLPMPKTLDEFYNTLVAFQQQDVNGNGIKDEVSEITIEGFSRGMAGWFGLTSNGLVSFLDNKAVSPWYQPHVKDYINYVSRLHKAGLLTTEGGVGQNNRSYIPDAYASETWEEPTITVPAGAAGPYYAPVVIQVYPDTPVRVYHTEYGYNLYWSSGMPVIPAASKNIEKAVALIDYLTSEEWWVLYSYGVEGYNFRYLADGSVERFTTAENQAQVPPGYTINGGVPTNWLNMFPELIITTNRAEDYKNWQAMGRSLGYADGWQLRTDFHNDFYNNKYLFEEGAESLLTFPTAREIDRMAQITPDLDTYSKELFAGLVMGTKSMDNWDTYMADLKRLGLDELIAINQARVDRGR
ncbi:sugar ABC transporter permease [Spirochaetia bacterium]|nr:sugar ABC transporter permease [Spirochaetia bacterium]